MKLSDRLAAIENDLDAPVPEKVAHASTAVVEHTPTPRRRRPRATSAKRQAWDGSKRKVRQLVTETLSPRMGKLSADELAREVRVVLDRIISTEDLEVSPQERRRFTEEILQDILGYGPLDPLLADPTVTEIMCNAHDEIWVERDGMIEATDVAFDDDVRYRQVIEKIVHRVGRRIDESSPMVDCRLPDGSRVNAIIPPLAIHGAVLTIRKFAADPYTATDLIGFGTFSLDMVTLLEACVRGKLNMLVSGGTGTGKTTTLNVLSSFIPTAERVVTIEDAAELRLQQPHVVSLEARPANAEGAGEVRIRDLVRNALRMRPDRIVVGEVRGAEALDMLQAMNTGHEGSLTTLHANSPRDALSRLETMVLMAGFDLPSRAIREQIVAALDLVVQLERMPDGRRVVTAVSEIQGIEGDTILLQDVFAWSAEADRLEATGLRPRFADRLAEKGISIPSTTFRRPDRPTGGHEDGSNARRRPYAAPVADAGDMAMGFGVPRQDMAMNGGRARRGGRR